MLCLQLHAKLTFARLGRTISISIECLYLANNMRQITHSSASGSKQEPQSGYSILPTPEKHGWLSIRFQTRYVKPFIFFVRIGLQCLRFQFLHQVESESILTAI